MLLKMFLLVKLNSSLLLQIESQKKMEAVCKIISDHPGKIVISGMSKSGLIAQKNCLNACSIGNKAVFLHPAEAVHGDLGIYAPGDPTILISKSGATDEIVRLIPILKEFNSFDWNTWKYEFCTLQ